VQFLRANTPVDVLIGPFVEDDNIGDTPCIGLVLDVEVSKNGQGLANKTDITVPAHDGGGNVDGYYNCELDATDTNTEGSLVLVAHHADALPVRHDYMVMAEAAWDSMFVAKDAGFMDVNIKTIGRVDAQEAEADNLETACANYSATRGLTGTAVPAAASNAAGGLPVSIAGALDLDAQIKTDIDAILVDTGTTLDTKIDAIDDFIDTEITAITAAVITNAAGVDISADILAIKTETALIVTDTGTTLDAKIDTIAGDVVNIDGAAMSGTNNGALAAVCTNVRLAELDAANLPVDVAAIKAETALIVADTDELQLDDTPAAIAAVKAETALIVADTNELQVDDVPTLIAAVKAETAAILLDTGTTLDTALAVVDANIDQIEAAVITNAAGVDIAADIIAIKVETANIVADTNELQTDDYPASIAAVKAETALIVADTNELQTDDTPAAIAAVKAETALIVADTNELQTDDTPADIAAVNALVVALNNISAADVNAQVLDVLSVDVFVEPGQENPAATASLVTKISYLYKLMRNRIETTAALVSVYNDAGAVVDQKSTISDDGVTFVRDEFVTGP